MIDERIRFDERYDNKENRVTTLYFIAPKDLLVKYDYDYPEAVSAEISIELPFNHLAAECGYASISPTDEDGTDYDWNDIDLPVDEIHELIRLAESVAGG